MLLLARREPQVLGQVDRGHPARTEFPLDRIAVGEGGLETLEEVSHEGIAPREPLLYGSGTKGFVKFV